MTTVALEDHPPLGVGSRGRAASTDVRIEPGDAAVRESLGDLGTENREWRARDRMRQLPRRADCRTNFFEVSDETLVLPVLSGSCKR